MDNKISSINFKANLQICRKSNKLLSNTRVRVLKDKAKQIGDSYNKIVILVTEKKNELTGNPATYIYYARHNFNIEKPAQEIENMAEVSGTVSSRAKQVYKIIDNYLNDIKKALSKK